MPVKITPSVLKKKKQKSKNKQKTVKNQVKKRIKIGKRKCVQNYM